MDIKIPTGIKQPLIIIGESDSILLLASKGGPDDPMANAVIYDKTAGTIGPEVWPAAVWLKFLYYVQEVDPPVDFTEQEALRRSQK